MRFPHVCDLFGIFRDEEYTYVATSLGAKWQAVPRWRCTKLKSLLIEGQIIITTILTTIILFFLSKKRTKPIGTDHLIAARETHFFSARYRSSRLASEGDLFHWVEQLSLAPGLDRESDLERRRFRWGNHGKPWWVGPNDLESLFWVGWNHHPWRDLKISSKPVQICPVFASIWSSNSNWKCKATSSWWFRLFSLWLSLTHRLFTTVFQLSTGSWSQSTMCWMGWSLQHMAFTHSRHWCHSWWTSLLYSQMPNWMGKMMLHQWIYRYPIFQTNPYTRPDLTISWGGEDYVPLKRSDSHGIC